MWDTRRECEPDTLTWFPQQFTMLMPSALDIIASSLQDIATSLNHPGPNSPLNPLTTQQAAVPRDIVTIFNGVLPVNDNKDTPSCLRVETEKEREPQSASTPTLPMPTLPTSDPTPPNPPPTTTIPPPPTLHMPTPFAASHDAKLCLNQPCQPSSHLCLLPTLAVEVNVIIQNSAYSPKYSRQRHHRFMAAPCTEP
jgi:hypothetical protein